MLYFSLYIAGQLLYTEGSKSYNMPEKRNQKNFRDQQILQPKTESYPEKIYLTYLYLRMLGMLRVQRRDADWSTSKNKCPGT